MGITSADATVFIIDTNGTGHGALAGFLRAAEVEVLICGGIGMGASNMIPTTLAIITTMNMVRDTNVTTAIAELMVAIYNNCRNR